MWFKNLQLYRFSRPFELDATTLGQQLEEQAFLPCGSQDTTRSGWVPPLGRHGSEFVHATNGYLMICLKRQDKLLPAAVINEELEQKALEIESREARQLPRKERRRCGLGQTRRRFAAAAARYAGFAIGDPTCKQTPAHRCHDALDQQRTMRVRVRAWRRM